MLNYTCDGCKSVVEKPQERGYLKKKHYCEACIKLVDDLLQEEIKIRAEASAKVIEKINELRSAFKSDRSEFSLPDER